MANIAHESKTLSVHRTFVVQLHEGAREGCYSGRVEHVASGRSAQFSSLELLLDFLADDAETDRSAERADRRR